MNPNNDGMGLHAFTGRHLFKIRQYLQCKCRCLHLSTGLHSTFCVHFVEDI